MATIIYAPIISEARGAVADCVFSVWKGRPYIRQRVIPHNPKSDDQKAVRESLARCVYLWQSLELEITDYQDKYSTAYRYSGFNWFVKANRAAEQAGTELKIAPPNKLIDPVDTLADAGGGASGSIVLTWANGTVGADYKVYILTRKTGDDEFVLAEKDTTLTSAGTVTITDLEAAATYDCFVLNEETLKSDFSASDFVLGTAGV